VPEIEWHIRTIKERTRCVYNAMPFTHLPARIVIELVMGAILWINSFPPDDGASRDVSPHALMTGQEINYSHHCRIETGAYAQVHEEHTNNMAPRTVGAIALRPTGNAQGTYYFFSLNTGRRLNRSHWTEVPMPQEVVSRVHSMARRGRTAGTLIFADRLGNPLEDDDAGSNDDSDYDPADDDGSDDDHRLGNDGADDPDTDADNDDDDDSDYLPNDADVNATDDKRGDDDADVNAADDELGDEADNLDDDELGGLDDGSNHNSQAAGVGNENTHNYEVTIKTEPDEDPPQDGGVDEGVAPTRQLGEEIILGPENVEQEIVFGPDNDDTDSDNQPEPTQAEMDAKYGERNNDHNLRPLQPKSYNHRQPRSVLRPKTFGDLHTMMMTQYNMRKGLKMFGEAGADAVLKEMDHFHMRKVGIPQNWKTLTLEERRAALRYLMFLKQKRCGTIKGRGCADGRKQCLYKGKDETSAPTVAPESLMLTCTIDAKEERDVATMDLPGAFMQADFDEHLHVLLEGEMAEALVRLDPGKYKEFLFYRHGKAALYVLLTKALYGMLQAALLFWKDLST
jgi:hypothetical protein